MHVIGTAGHVDHGKSSLVQALTGTNPDRWAEEQLRGMTLDLGFAHLRFEDGTEAGIVDVPGHERFLHNMLAGAAGMELLLLVIDAAEGIKPQTLEHLHVLQFLNVQKTIVVLTKIDLLENEMREAACARMHDALAGTLAEDAPVMAVSNVTGYNIAELKEAIRRSLHALPARPVDAPAYLPVDRVFALPGHGTIVTGTLMQGAIAVGDTLMFQPSGKSVRVRSLQSFGLQKERVRAGARVAVNVPWVSTAEIARGAVLAEPQFEAGGTFVVRFRALPQSLPLLRGRNAVRAYIGSAEILGTLILQNIPAHGEEAAGRLALKNAIAVYPGMPFIVRRLSPKDLLGGGTIAGMHSAPAGTALQTDPLQIRVLQALEGAQPAPMTAEDVARAVNAREDAAAAALSRLVASGDAVAVMRPSAFVHAHRANELLSSARAFMQEREAFEPWSLGVTSLALARALNQDEATLLRVLLAFAEDGSIAHGGGYFATTAHVPKLSAEQQAFFDSIVAGDAANPMVPVPLAAAVAAVKQSRIGGVAKAFDTLLAKGALVKVNEDLYRGSQIAAIRARMQAFLRENDRMTMAQFRDLIGTSRKFAVPLLEWFDARGVTVRSGDYRMLRGRT
ncbi:MAG: selenocysteine-specific translation elongation factor [Candidatus Baltobacteraceae bacterium]